MDESLRICAVIPSYNHSAKIQWIVDKLLENNLDVIMVDDASDTEHAKILKAMSSSNSYQDDQVKLVVHNLNQGKGGAVMSGLLYAKAQGYHAALQVDADGQHNLNDINKMLSLAKENPGALISGKPVYDDSIPKARLWGRKLTHFWVHVETLSLQVQDTMCGFRIYPLQSTCQLISDTNLGKRMDFDIDVMVRLFWRNVPVVFLPTQVKYPEDGQSHFRAFQDNALITWLHIRLVIGMLIRMPFLIKNKFKVKSINTVKKSNIESSKHDRS